MKPLILILIICIASCKHWDCPERNRDYSQPFDDIVLSYFGNYQNDDYWIYKDSVTNQIDTLFLTGYKKQIAADAPGDCNYHEVFYYSLKNGSSIEIDINFTIKGDFVDGDISIQKGNTYDILSIAYSNNSFQSNGYSVENIQVIPNFNVFEINYENVLAIENNTNDITLYFAPNIGLIGIIQSNLNMNYKLLTYKLNN